MCAASAAHSGLSSQPSLGARPIFLARRAARTREGSRGLRWSVSLNKLPWFSHDHDAHEDAWLRHAVRQCGHVAGWVWWVLLELLHKHGTGDTLRYPLVDIARAALTSPSVITRVLTQLGTEFHGQATPDVRANPEDAGSEPGCPPSDRGSGAG